MPVYEFRCSEGHVTDIMRSLEDRNEPACCGCGLPSSRIMSATPTTFKFADSSGRKRSRSNPLDRVQQDLNFKSPIDGEVITSHRKLTEHMKKHDVVPYERVEGKARKDTRAEKAARISALRDSFEHNRDRQRYNRN